MIKDTMTTQYTVWRVILNVLNVGSLGDTRKERTGVVLAAAAFLVTAGFFEATFLTGDVFLAGVFFVVAIINPSMPLKSI